MTIPLPNYSDTSSLIKDIAALVKKGATIEAQEKIMALREVVLALQEENLALRTDLKSLKEKADLAELMKFNGAVYQISGQGARDGFYCPICFDKDQKAIHVQYRDNVNDYYCRACRNVIPA